jgi:hypothetical protein
MRHTKANLVVGKSQVPAHVSSHVRGTHEGNRPGRLSEDDGIDVRDRWTARARPRRSTGIAPDDRMPIDPTSPILSPA